MGRSKNPRCEFETGNHPLGRRDFARYLLAALGASIGARPAAAQPSRTEAAKARLDEASRTHRALAKDYLTIDYSARREGRGLLCRSIDTPDDWVLTPICISKTVRLGSAGARAGILLPCPRDLGDQAHIATKVSAYSGGKPIAAGVISRVIYSRPCEQNPHINPFTLTEIERVPARDLEVRQITWLMQPVHRSPMPATALLAKAKDSADFARKYEIDAFKHWCKPAGNKAVESLAREAKACKSAAESIDLARRRAGAMTWERSLSTSDVVKVANNGFKGDCSTKATVAKFVGGGHLEMAEGYAVKMIKEFGGRHVVNLGIANGMFLLDPRHVDDFYLGPQNDNYITTTLGGYLNVPDYARFDIPDGFINGGYWRALGANGEGEHAVLSSTHEGVCARDMAALRPSKEVQAHFQARKEVRKFISGASR